MIQYIDKAVILEKIKTLKKGWSFGSSTEAKYKVETYEELIDFLDTLEVKEVDLEKELESFFYPHVPWGDYSKYEQEDIKEWSFKIAEHFFKLGLKVKGE